MGDRARRRTGPLHKGEPIVIGEGCPVSRRHAGPAGAEELAVELELQRREFERLRQIIERINLGVHLEEILDFIYEEFRDVMPYSRIGFASLEPATGMVVSRWARSDEPLQIATGYSYPLAGTSLTELARTGRPRVINDLEEYGRAHPESELTRRLVAEKLRSSLACPLAVEGRPVGFLFFDAKERSAYRAEHIEFFLQIAGILAVVIERGRMYSELSAQKATIERQNRQLAEENRRNQEEMEMARRVQRMLIPGRLPTSEHWELAMSYEPAQLVGGDLLDCERAGDEALLLYMADAMGHGVAAALLMSVVGTAFHSAVVRQRQIAALSPGAILAEVNRTVLELFEMNYVTAVCAVIDARQWRIVMASAGHPPPLLRRAATGQEEMLDKGGVPLGISAEAPYANEVIPLSPGDMLLFYTDGVIEAAGPEGVRFGLAALRESVASAGRESSERLVARLREELGRHCKCAALEDDLTMLAVRMA